MKYPKYPAYKESGVEWIGIIPKGWEVKKLSRCLSRLESGNREFSGGNQLKDGVLSIGGEHIDWEGNINLTNPKYIKESFYFNLNSGKVKEEDILLVKDGATIGKIAYVKELPVKQVAINEHVFLLRTNKLLHSKFLYYFLYSKIGQTQILSNVRGAAQGGLNSSFVQRLYISIPPLLVQKNISSFLDNEIERLSKLIYKENNIMILLKEKRQAIITTAVTKGLYPNVPMKDSGIEWIGQIPDHWKLKKLKFVSKVNFSTVDKHSFSNEIPVLLVNYTDVYNNQSITKEMEFMKATANINEIKKFQLKAGDVLVTKDSETPDDIAIPALVKSNLPNMLCGYHLAMLRPNSYFLYSNYLFYLYSDKKFRGKYECEANGITRFGLTQDSFSGTYICMPSLSEQVDISLFLEEQTSKIDSLISRSEEMIELLKENKTSLITQAVTGKIDVRGVTPPTTPSDSLH